jgi:hypothetical protein
MQIIIFKNQNSSKFLSLFVIGWFQNFRYNEYSGIDLTSKKNLTKRHWSETLDEAIT